MQVLASILLTPDVVTFNSAVSSSLESLEQLQGRGLLNHGFDSVREHTKFRRKLDKEPCSTRGSEVICSCLPFCAYVCIVRVCACMGRCASTVCALMHPLWFLVVTERQVLREYIEARGQEGMLEEMHNS